VSALAGRSRTRAGERPVAGYGRGPFPPWRRRPLQPGGLTQRPRRVRGDMPSSRLLARTKTVSLSPAGVLERPAGESAGSESRVGSRPDKPARSRIDRRFARRAVGRAFRGTGRGSPSRHRFARPR